MTKIIIESSDAKFLCKLIDFLNSTAAVKEGSTVITVAAEGDFDNSLERVFPETNQWHDRIFYDPTEGKYYDKYSDVYLSLEEAHAFGLGWNSRTKKC